MFAWWIFQDKIRILARKKKVYKKDHCLLLESFRDEAS